MRKLSGMAVAAFAVVGTCGIEPTDPRGHRPVADVPTGGPCPQYACGANSPVLETHGFHDLSLVSAAPMPATATTPNDAGFAIAASDHRAQIVSRAGASYDLRVEDGRIIGRCRTGGCAPLRGGDLLGATIALARGDARYAIAIANVRPLDYFLGGGQTEAYTLQWMAAGRPAENLCDGPAGAPRASTSLGGDEAVVFEGDRIDARRRTMSNDAETDDDWFNIGCADSALAKLRLTRNTVHSQLRTAEAPSRQARYWEQRQATLKMYSADYCGTGAAFTVPGQRLVWKGDLMAEFFAPPSELEARWNENGASCLYRPRMLSPTSSIGAAAFPDVERAIARACAVPTCTNLDVRDFDGQDRVSSNPVAIAR